MSASTFSAIPTQWTGHEALLVCPYCGDDHVHPTGLRCLPASKSGGEIVIDEDGVRWDPDQQPVGRGVVIVLEFACESSHVFYCRLQFHKGSTIVTRQVRFVRCPLNDTNTIWRN